MATPGGSCSPDEGSSGVGNCGGDGESGAAQPAHSPPPLSPPSPAYVQPSLKGEWKNIAILVTLYFLQGVPMGLTACVPLFLKEKVSLADIATFSLCAWPYSLKLLWAPIVDSVFVKRFGRRKSWVVPMQLLVGCVLLGLSGILQVLLDANPPRILVLTAGFFLLYFLVATQDIAVDGWALTLLRRENVGYASSCNSIGVQLGYSTSYVAFLAGTSPELANYFRQEPGAEGWFTMEAFLNFWGIVFIVTTAVVVALRLREPEEDEADAHAAATAMACHRSDVGGAPVTPQETAALLHSSVDDGSDVSVEYARPTTTTPTPVPVTVPVWVALQRAYREMLSIMQLRAVGMACLFSVSVKVGFLAESALQFELMEKGVKKEQMLLLGLPLLAIEVLVTVFVSHMTSGPRPLTIYLRAFVVRLVLMSLFSVAFATLSYDPSEGNGGPLIITFFLMTIAFRIPSIIMFTAQMAFYARIADPAMGGSYMTLLNTITNLGSMWNAQVGLRAISAIDDSCKDGACSSIDGFVVVNTVSGVLGVAWYYFMHRRVLELEVLKQREWQIGSGPTFWGPQSGPRGVVP